MSIANIKNRLVKLEQRREGTETPAPTVHVFLRPKSDMIPNIFDRPLEQWEIYKKQFNSDKMFPSIAIFEVDAEAAARGGNLPLVPISRYDDFMDARDPHRGNMRIQTKQINDGLDRIFKDCEKSTQCQP